MKSLVSPFVLFKRLPSSIQNPFPVMKALTNGFSSWGTTCPPFIVSCHSNRQTKRVSNWQENCPRQIVLCKEKKTFFIMFKNHWKGWKVSFYKIASYVYFFFYKIQLFIYSEPTNFSCLFTFMVPMSEFGTWTLLASLAFLWNVQNETFLRDFLENSAVCLHSSYEC